MLLLEDDRIDAACECYSQTGKTQWGFDDASWRSIC